MPEGIDGNTPCPICGKRRPIVVRLVGSETFAFCSMEHADAFSAAYAAIKEKEIGDAAKQSVLPRVRAFIAFKTKEGITVVSRDSEVQGRDTSEKH